MASKFKKKAVYTEKYNRGAFESNRKKVSDWVLDDNVWLEVRESGVNDDNSEFITITINNITKFPTAKTEANNRTES
jgi:hypothetical protein